MGDTTPLWLLAIALLIIVIGWVAWEIHQARTYGRQKHYVSNFFYNGSGTSNEKAVSDNIPFLNPNRESGE